MSALLCDLTASEAVQQIKTKSLSALDLAKACAARIELFEPKLRAWAYFNPDLLFEQARRVDEKIIRGEFLGVLTGIPVGVKDIFNSMDMPTEMGSPLWKDFMPGNDARVVFYLKMADALIAGKTVTAEFAVHAPGPTVNPLDPERIPGTSSSGSAVAVASGMVPCAIGTQTAGSIIRPASYCGVLGFKPSFGLLPRTGMLKTTDSLDTIGFFARSVEDLRMMFEVMRVRGQDYPISHAHLNDPTWQKKTDKRWKVAVVRSPVWDDAEKYAQEAFLRLAETLEADDELEVSRQELPGPFDRAHGVHETIYDKSLSYYFKEEFNKKTLISREIKEMIEQGHSISTEEFRSALRDQNVLIRLLDDFLTENDILITLSTSGEAPKVGEKEKKDSCLIWTLCGVSVIGLPLLQGPAGLPIGVQIVARRYADYKLLEFVHWLAGKELKRIHPMGAER